MSDAADRLARSRLALLEQVSRQRDGRSRNDNFDEDDELWEANDRPAQRRGRNGRSPGGWFGAMRHAVASWWRHHPAHMGLELATPALSDYAARRPLRFLGIAAAVGALAVVVRPWRLISVTGLLVALVKSSQLSSVVMSALSAADYRRDATPYE